MSYACFYTIHIQPQNEQLQMELDSSTTVYELFEFLKETFEYEGDFKKWTCYSDKRQRYLNIQEQIGNYLNENITIKTTYSIVNEYGKIKDISLQIHIIDGKLERGFQATFKSNNTLNEIAQATLSYCQLLANQDTATVDLFIFNQAYNDKIKREKTLSDLQIKDNTTIQAKIRWIGGEQY